MPGDGFEIGRIIAVHRELYRIVTNDGEFEARITGSFRNSLIQSEMERTGKSVVHEVAISGGYPVIGDFVRVRRADAESCTIHAIEPRHSVFYRINSAGHAESYRKTALRQAVAANFDYVFIMQSLNRDFNPRRLERYLTLAWESGATPAVVLTKSDLAGDYTEQLRQTGEVAAGVDVFAVSAVTGEGLDALRGYIEAGKTVVFLGSSGVGKSSLVNALAGKVVMAAGDIREDDDRGRHTTTHRQLIMLDSGVMIIDTPGMRELGICDADEGLTQSFSDVEQYFGQCRFSDCSHKTEPGCALRAAIERGELSAERWESYLRLRDEARFADDKAGYLRDKEQWCKSISKINKNAKRNGGLR